MYQTKITDKDAGQRLDKYLHRILPRAGSGFLYKMLRKKNITLNDKKADGSERIAAGDSVEIYFSDETLAKFMGRRVIGGLECAGKKNEISTHTGSKSGNIRHTVRNDGRLKRTDDENEREIIKKTDYRSAYEKIKGVRILYENDHILLLDKPAGVLSQKAERTDFSLNEWLIGYLLKNGAVTEEDLITFKPSVCNRLDRNTSGIVLCSKSLKGAQLIGELLKNRMLRKYYRLYVKGIVRDEQMIEGYLIKDEKLNKVFVEPVSPHISGDSRETKTEEVRNKSAHKQTYNTMKSLEEIKSSYIKTGYKPVRTEQDKTLLEVELFTGKTHQIRAHLASIGHPLLGDPKYGDMAWNEEYRKKYHVKAQLLHAYKVVFPQLEEPFEDLNGRAIVAELPEIFGRVSDMA